MKKSFLSAMVLYGCFLHAMAQVPAVTTGRLSVTTPKKTYQLQAGKLVLSSENSYLAKRVTPTLSIIADTFSLTRPGIRTAAGLIPDYSAGIPKHAYGYRNGKLLLRTSGATSSGTITGSGVVGTGSSLGNIGSTGSGIGLNGKTPDAGSGMWGNARNLISSSREKKDIMKQ